MRHDLFAERVERPNDGDSIHRSWPHGEVGLIALPLAVVLLVAFHVDDVWDMGGQYPAASFQVFVQGEILVENSIGGICFENLLAFELLEQSALEEARPEDFFTEFGDILIVGTFDQLVLAENQLDLFLTNA